MEKRPSYFEKIRQDFEIVPIVALLGPRQSGKTTLAKEYAKSLSGKVHYFDLEDYTDLAKFENPKLTLEALDGLIIIDEIQRRPDLFPFLRVMVDKSSLKFLILGSASRELLQQSSETLAGRVAYINVSPFQLSEVNDQQKLWVRGGFPRSFLASSDEASFRWREVYMQTYFEKDLVSIGLILPPQRILRLWKLLSQFHGNIVNYTTMAEFLDISVPKLKDYIALLEGTFLIRTLSPWFENGGKRVVKTPKIYLRDSGIFHEILGLKNYEELILNVERGSSWEGFALEEVIKALNLRTEECYFWATHQLAELDLFIIYQNRRYGFEFKCTDQPKITKSMRSAFDALSLDHLWIITPIQETFKLEDKVTVLALKDCIRIRDLE